MAPSHIPPRQPVLSTVGAAFPAPEESVRIPTDAFGESLRSLPLLPAGRPPLTHAGRIVPHSARVIDMPLIPGDLQQCADSVIRVRAEWLRQRGGEVVFHATSGDPLPWSRYRDGERPVVEGARVRWRQGGDGEWDSYLTAVFRWAGTASLEQLDTVAATGPPRAGDVLVEGGFPGHAVLILDAATDGETTWLLLAEGYMPAQQFHVELGPHDGWWRWGPGLDLGHWRLGPASHRRWRRDYR